MDNDKVYICLADGHVFEGRRFGSGGDVIGELVFTTGMCGYVETLTDPSYYGQIVMQTFPLIGNYGIIKADRESRSSFVSAYIVREKCDNPSNFRCDETLDRYLKDNSIIGVYGVDTREITRIIRESGVMNAAICTNPKSVEMQDIKSYAVKNAVAATSQKSASLTPSEGEHKYNVVLLDYGAKKNIARELAKRGCNVAVMPYNTKAEDILALKPDGIMLSNGAGNPEDNEECIAEIKKLIGKKPIFGICLGHQLLALAMGAKTKKLKYGHRGANQPVKNLQTGRTFISSQNHGYAVVDEGIESCGGEVSYINANDLTNEGIDYPGKSAFSVQFHPEACSGPHDTRFLFDKFISMMEENANASE
ncbi:MAG: carbamoyl phosphate synthase small subunit [Clostridiales bacterium]|nr:carbamoyl phosphate synthase small subunit [Clostridiales bacterium]